MVLPKASRGTKADSASGKERQAKESKKRGAGASPPTHPATKKPAREGRQTSRGEQKGSGPSPAPSVRRQAKKPSPSGHNAVNRRLKVYWPGRKLWQDGIVTAYNEKEDTHFVRYDTGEEQWVTLRAKEDNRRLKWVDNGDGPGSPPPVASPPAELGCDVDDNADKTEVVGHPSHRRSRSGSSVQGSGVPSQSRTSSRVAKPSLKRQVQLEERHSTGAGAEGRGAGSTNTTLQDCTQLQLNEQGAPGDSLCEGTEELNGTDSGHEHGRNSQGEGGKQGESSKDKKQPCSRQDRKGLSEDGVKQEDSGPSTSTAGNGKLLRNAKGELLSPSGETEKELRARAEVAWLRTYEALNKAVRLVKLAREGPGGDPPALNFPSHPGEQFRSPPSGDHSPLTSPTSGSRKLSSRARKNSEKGEALNQAQQPPTDAALRARISVFWPGNGQYYKAVVTGYNSEKDLHCIEYDDGEEEWLNLGEEYFKWLGPRTRSAGYSQAQCASIMALNPEEIVPPTAELLANSISAAETDGPLGEQAVGWRLAILWEADGHFYEAEILSFKNNKHHILYADGEDEWVQLNKELKLWRQKGRGSSKPANLGPGIETPRGRAAIGWRVGVYWKEDTVFYPGEVRGYDSATGKHHIHYDDNEDEYISLSTEKIKWIVPPNMPDRKPANRKRLRATSLRTSKRAALVQEASQTSVVNGSKPSSEVLNPAPLRSQGLGTKGKDGQLLLEDARQRTLPSTAGPSPGPALAPSLLSDKAKRTGLQKQVKLPEGSVCRRIRRSALSMAQDGSSRISSLVRMHRNQPNRKEDAHGEIDNKTVQVCILDACKVSPFPSDVAGAQVAGCGRDSDARITILSRMLARVGSGQESLKHALPPGSQPCRQVAQQLGKPPPVLMQSPRNLQSVRVSVPQLGMQKLPQTSKEVKPQLKHKEALPLSPFEPSLTPKGLVTDAGGLSSVNIPTPSTFDLDNSPQIAAHTHIHSPMPQHGLLTPHKEHCAVKTIPAVNTVSESATLHMGSDLVSGTDKSLAGFDHQMQ